MQKGNVNQHYRWKQTPRSLAHSPVDYCAEHLFPNNPKKQNHTRYRIFQTLYKEDGILGEIDFDDSIIDPKEFTMIIDCAGSKRTVMETCQYEMVPFETICPRRVG